MDQAGAQGRVELSAAPDGTATVRITGSWTLQHFAEIERSIQPVRVALPAQARLDLDGLGALDTAGAGLLSVLLGPERLHAMLDALPDLAPERRALLETVGGAVQAIWCQSRLLLGFVGLTLETLARNLLRPHR